MNLLAQVTSTVADFSAKWIASSLPTRLASPITRWFLGVAGTSPSSSRIATMTAYRADLRPLLNGSERDTPRDAIFQKLGFKDEPENKGWMYV